VISPQSSLPVVALRRVAEVILLTSCMIAYETTRYACGCFDGPQINETNCKEHNPRHAKFGGSHGALAGDSVFWHVTLRSWARGSPCFGRYYRLAWPQGARRNVKCNLPSVTEFMPVTWPLEMGPPGLAYMTANWRYKLKFTHIRNFSLLTPRLTSTMK
jgi:hypothetical protein